GQNIDFVYGVEAIRQHIRQRLSVFRGEYSYDLTYGIPYHDEFFKKNFNPVIIDTILKSTIIDTPGVIELVEFNLDFSDTLRELSLTFKAMCNDGVIDYSDIISL
ncbi:unnamed protein product, partial [marine sediment metagenome]